MLVDVVQLRFEGVRRPRADVRAEAPIRGLLALSVDRPGRFAGQKNPPLLAALTSPERLSAFVLPPLDFAQVRAIRGNNLLVVGWQEILVGRKRAAEYTQSWWCRLVFDQGPPGPPVTTKAPAFFRTSGVRQLHEEAVAKIAKAAEQDLREAKALWKG